MNKVLKAARKNAARFSAVAATLALVGANAAHAAVDISADVTAAKADISSNGGLIIGVVVTIAAIAWLRRIIK